MKIRVHWLFFVFLFYIGYLGQLFEALLFFIIVIIHELGHVFVARSFGWRVTEIEFLPFGGVAKVDWNFKGWPKEEKLVAIAGPINNFIMIVIAFVLFRLGIIERDFVVFFIKANLIIAGFNLLPALPLDGGRIYRAIASQEYGWVAGTKRAYRLSYIIGTILIAIGVSMWLLGYINITFLVLGVFLLIATYTDSKHVKYQQMYSFMHKNYHNIENNSFKELKHISVDKNEQVSRVLKGFSPGITTIVWVLEDNKIIGTLTDYQILQRVFANEVAMYEPMSKML
jgi:stage IV sporulation protein FB